LTSTIECRTSAKIPVSFLLLRNNKIIAVIEKIFDLSGDAEIRYDDKDVCGIGIMDRHLGTPRISDWCQ
jgi:hypothetical protein